MLKLNAKELRKRKPLNGEDRSIKRNPIYFVLDTIMDTYNIGSIFRLADAVAVEKIYICGDTDYPPSSRIHKAAVGTEEWVPWEKRTTALEVVKELKEKGVLIVSVEQDKRSIPFTLLATRLNLPVALVVGHETNGVSKEVLDISDVIVELPMFGINKSINVWGSLAIITYKVIEYLILKPYIHNKKK